MGDLAKDSSGEESGSEGEGQEGGEGEWEEELYTVTAQPPGQPGGQFRWEAPRRRSGARARGAARPLLHARPTLTSSLTLSPSLASPAAMQPCSHAAMQPWRDAEPMDSCCAQSINYMLTRRGVSTQWKVEELTRWCGLVLQLGLSPDRAYEPESGDGERLATSADDRIAGTGVPGVAAQLANQRRLAIRRLAARRLAAARHPGPGRRSTVEGCGGPGGAGRCEVVREAAGASQVRAGG